MQVSFCMCHSQGVCLCVSFCLSSLVCKTEITFVYIYMVFWFNVYFFFFFFYLDVRAWLFEHLICMCFVFFLFAPVQCNRACFTWKGALEICSLLLLSLLLPFQKSSVIGSGWTSISVLAECQYTMGVIASLICNIYFSTATHLTHFRQ